MSQGPCHYPWWINNLVLIFWLTICGTLCELKDPYHCSRNQLADRSHRWHLCSVLGSTFSFPFQQPPQNLLSSYIRGLLHGPCPLPLSLASTQPKVFRFSFLCTAFCVPFTVMNLQETNTCIPASSELLENFVFTVLHRQFLFAFFSSCFIKMKGHESLFPYMMSFPWSMASAHLVWPRKT